MRIFCRLFTLCLFLSTCTGCGPGSMGGLIPSSPFAGSWIGTSSFSSGINSQQINVGIVIGSDGKASFALHNLTLKVDGTGTGTVANSGDISGDVYYPGEKTLLSGTVSINSSGHLVGVIRQYTTGNILIGMNTIDLTKQ